MSATNKQSWDTLGMCTSMLCAVHCLAIPFLMVAGAESLLFFIDSEWMEWALLLSALVIGLFAFISGVIKHKKHFFLVLFIAGFLLLITGESVEGMWLGSLISAGGALVIIYAHYFNRLSLNAAS